MTDAANAPLRGSDGACDCHTHVFLDPVAYPFTETRKYTPPPASAAELKGLLDSLGLQRVVIVQPSVYGTDNSATLAGIRAFGPERARGVAVIEETTAPVLIEQLSEAGIRGIRVNFELAGEDDHRRAARHLRAMAEKVAPYGWHVQVYAKLEMIQALADTIRHLPVPLVLDHFAGASGDKGMSQPGLAEVIDLVGEGKAYVKVSAAYRSSRRAPRYDDLTSIVRAFIDANPERVLWGSDWPHPDPTRPPEEISPRLPIDDAGVFSLLANWAGTDSNYRKILRDNPVRLYDF